jgi:hypothetical protein
MRTPLRFAAVVPVAFAATLVACGSSTPTPTASTSAPSTSSTSAPSTAIPTAAPTATPTAALTSLTCPSEDTVNSDLGLNLAAPTSQPAEDLPAGASGIVCTYSSASQAVVIDIATGAITTSFISMVEAGEQQAAQAQGSTFTATDTSGVGSQAAIVAVAGGANPAENGILAVSGNTGLVITVLPPLSQSQLQSFASQLLG